MLCDPMQGWRHIEVTERCTAVDYAHVLKDLVDVYYLDALLITVVQDNLNTHRNTADILCERSIPPILSRKILFFNSNPANFLT